MLSTPKIKKKKKLLKKKERLNKKSKIKVKNARLGNHRFDRISVN